MHACINTHRPVAPAERCPGVRRHRFRGHAILAQLGRRWPRNTPNWRVDQRSATVCAMTVTLIPVHLPAAETPSKQRRLNWDEAVVAHA